MEPLVWGGEYKDDRCFGQHKWGEDSFCQRCGAWKGSLGLEPTPEMYAEHLLEIFDEVWRVLRDDGTFWLNIADSYAGSGQGWQKDHSTMGRKWLLDYNKMRPPNYISSAQNGVKPKDIYGIPWLVALALRERGWYLRSAIIWAKGAPIPESVKDRPTRSYEYIFLLTKKADYYYDHVAIAEAALDSSVERDPRVCGGYKHAFMTQFAGSPNDKRHPEGKAIEPMAQATRNKRNVWLVPRDIDMPFNYWLAERMGLDAFRELVEEYLAGQDNAQDVWRINTRGNPLRHFATFPEALVEPCILAGTSEHGVCKCGAPWERVVEKPESPHDGETESEYAEGTTAKRLAKLRQAARERGEEYATVHKTIGWGPTCKCGEQEVQPATVLDPFSGVGTTGVVALRHGRDYIGIDLSPVYHEMALKRLTTKEWTQPKDGTKTKVDDLPLFAKEVDDEDEQSIGGDSDGGDDQSGGDPAAPTAQAQDQ